MRRVLIKGTADDLLRLWPQAFPHLARPESRERAEEVFHVARTATKSVPMKLRQHSHAWLTDRNLPSMLPDILRPKAESRGPRIVDAVGIAVRSAYPEVKQAIGGVMRSAVLEAYGDGRRDPAFVKQRMLEARRRERKALGLRPLNS